MAETTIRQPHPSCLDGLSHLGFIARHEGQAAFRIALLNELHSDRDTGITNGTPLARVRPFCTILRVGHKQNTEDALTVLVNLADLAYDDAGFRKAM